MVAGALVVTAAALVAVALEALLVAAEELAALVVAAPADAAEELGALLFDAVVLIEHPVRTSEVASRPATARVRSMVFISHDWPLSTGHDRLRGE